MSNDNEGNMQFVLSFDGKNDYVEARDPFENKKCFTISMWLNPSVINDGHYHGFIGKQGDRFRKPGMWLAPADGGLHYDSYAYSGKRYASLIKNFFEAENQWIHVAWTKKDAVYKIYRNGELFFKETAPMSFYTVKNSYWIGRVDNFFPGRIAEVRIWNRARTQKDIQKDMHRRSRGDEPGLTAYWPFDDGAGARAADKTAGDNHGTIVGPSWTRSTSEFSATDSPGKASKEKETEPEAVSKQTAAEPVEEKAAELKAAAEQTVAEPVEEKAAEPGGAAEQTVEEPVEEKAAEPKTAAEQTVEEPVEEKAAEPEVAPEQTVEEPVEEKAAEPKVAPEQTVEEPAGEGAKGKSVEEAERCRAGAENRPERLASANDIVKKRTMAAAGVGLIPIPVVDLLVLTGLQLDMIRVLAKLYTVPFNKEIGKTMLAALVGVGVPLSVSPSLASMIKLIPLVGQTTGELTMSAIGGATTYAVGKVFIQHFESGGTFLNFDPEKTKAYYCEQLEKGKTAASS